MKLTFHSKQQIKESQASRRRLAKVPKQSSLFSENDYVSPDELAEAYKKSGPEDVKKFQEWLNNS